MQTLVKPETRNTLPTVFHRRPTFEEAKMLITGRAITLKEYNQFRLNNPAYRLPCQPQVAYADKWTSSHEFFGKPKYSASDAMKKYWAEVKAGTRPKPKSRKGKKNIKTTKSTIALKGTVIQVVKSQTTLEDKQTFIALAKKLGVYDQVKPAFKTLFTYDELLELVNL
jgi:hypothetical protein